MTSMRATGRTSEKFSLTAIKTSSPSSLVVVVVVMVVVVSMHRSYRRVGGWVGHRRCICGGSGIGNGSGIGGGSSVGHGCRISLYRSCIGNRPLHNLNLFRIPVGLDS